MKFDPSGIKNISFNLNRLFIVLTRYLVSPKSGRSTRSAYADLDNIFS